MKPYWLIHRERRPEHRTRNGTGTDRNAHTRNARATSAAFAASICISSSWQKCRWQCTWPHHLHFEPPAKCKWDFCQNSYLDERQQFCLIHGLSAFCYCHKMQLETPACGRRSCPHLVAGNSRWQCVMVTSCTWSFHLHFEPLLKCKWDFLSASYLDAWQQFCPICDLSASCYRHKMQLGTLACQEKIICTVNGRSICILGRPQNANEISCPLVT